MVLTPFYAFAITLSFRGTWNFVSTYETAYYAGARDEIYREVAYWLAENSEAEATIALLEVGTIGYFSHRRIIDLAGLVTYELRDLPKQGTYAEAINLLRPDYIIGCRGLPPDPDLDGIEGYQVVASFPKGEHNLFEDMVIYKLQ